MIQRFSIIPALLASLLLWGCGSQSQEEATGPAKVTRADNCHVCGMIVPTQKGPKGQARIRGAAKPAYFCSTSDLMAFLFQPDSPAVVKEAWVHNMHGVDWKSPPDDAYIDAYKAWYVIEHDLRGAMGHTLAPFAEKEQAEEFVTKHGGRILRYEEITVDLIAGMAAYAFPDFDKVRDFDPEIELGGGGQHNH